MSNRRAKSKRRSGHPARVAAQRAPEIKKGRRVQNGRPRRSRRAPRRRSAPSWAVQLRARLLRAWQALLKPALVGSRSDAPPLTELVRADLAWATATGLIGAALFATALTGHTYLGDGPETVAGVSSLGILHDPGYPSYVLVAHMFTLLVPVGSEAFRVNLFSLVCASLSIAVLQLLARRLGTARWAASLGALTLAASAGFWFYSDFAKHDIFSGLLFLLSLHLALAWRARPTTGRLVALAVVLAFGLGSSWPLELLVLPSVLFVLLGTTRELRLRSLAAATATGLVVLAAVYGFVMVRAAQNPPINWGGATTVSRLAALVDRADFTAHGSSAHASSAGSSGAGAAKGAGAAGGAAITAPASVASDVNNDAVSFGRELGVLALLLAVLGLIASLTWRRSKATYPVLIAFLANLIGATAVVSFGQSSGGFDDDLINEGFVLGCYFALACWVAVGASELVGALGKVGASDRLHERSSRLQAAFARTRPLAPVAAVALGAALLVPLAAGNWSVVHRSSKPFADRYAQAAFADLPPHAAVFILGAELTQPLIYRQVVYHQRLDVAVIAADGLEYGWYRQQVSRRLGIQLPAATGNALRDGVRVIAAVARVRSVYLDPRAADGFGVGYRPVGLLEQLAPGRGPQKISSPSKVEARLLEAERRAGFPDANWHIWPNDAVELAEYAAAGLKVAQAYYEQRDYAGMRSALLNVLTVQPGEPTAERDLARLRLIGGGG